MLSKAELKKELKNLVQDTLSFLNYKSPLKTEQKINFSSPQKTKTIIPEIKPRSIDSTVVKETKTIDQPKHSSFESIVKEPLKMATLDTFEDIKVLIQPLNLIHIEQPKDDQVAKKLRYDWKYDKKSTSVYILTWKESPLTQKFIEQVCQAITLQLTSCDLIDLEKLSDDAWQSLFESAPKKLIIASKDLLTNHPKASSYCHNQQIPQFGLSPLLIVPNFSQYLEQPHLKSSLWS